jgi:homogentisate phytyltransferase/homogentisate geranylgeranyltransferase
VLVGAHGVMACALWGAKLGTDTTSGASMTAMYMFIWKLFYAEYALLPLFGR